MKPRYAIIISLNQDDYDRSLKLRANKWKWIDIFRAGILSIEEMNNKAKKLVK